MTYIGNFHITSVFFHESSSAVLIHNVLRPHICIEEPFFKISNLLINELHQSVNLCQELQY